MLEGGKKRMLIIKACDVKGESHERSAIRTQAEMYDIAVDDICPTTYDELEKALAEKGRYDYIYLSAHGDEDGFSNGNGIDPATLDVLWEDFGLMLCEQQSLEENVVLLLSCCRGGLNQVAYKLFHSCKYISYIVGPRQSLASYEMLISFNIFLYNITHRDVDPIVACEKVKGGTDIRMMCFDRLEVMGEPGYQWYVEGVRQEEERELEELNANSPTKEVRDRALAEATDPSRVN